MLERVIAALARSIVRARLGVLLVVAALTAFSAAQLPALRVDFTPQDLFARSAAEDALHESFKITFGSTENVLIAALETDAPTAPQTLAYVYRLSEALLEHPSVSRVDSLTHSPFARVNDTGALDVSPIVDTPNVSAEAAAEVDRAVQRSGLIRGMLYGRNGRGTAVIAHLDESALRAADAEAAFAQAEAIIAANPAPDGVRLHVGGVPAIRVIVMRNMIQDQVFAGPLAFFFAALLLFASFRWMPATVAPLLGVLITAVIVVGGMAMVGETMNILTSIVPILILIIGVSDGIHVVSRFLEERRTAATSMEAAQRTVETMAVACFVTSLTTAIGFGSLVVSRNALLRDFGMLAAIGIMLAYVVTIAVIPVLLTLTKPPKRVTDVQGEGRMESALGVVVAAVLKRPRAVLGVSALLGVVAFGLASQLKVDTFMLETNPPNDPVSVATRFLESELDGALPMEVSLRSTTRGRFNDPEVLNAVSALQRDIEAERGVLNTTSYADHLRDVWATWADDPRKLDADFRSVQQVASLASLLEGANDDPTEPFVTFDRRALRINVAMRDFGASNQVRVAHAIEGYAAHRFAGIDDISYFVTGDAYAGSSSISSLVADLVKSLLGAYLVIFVVLAVLFRSVRLALISMPSNVLPLVATAAFMVVTGMYLNTLTVVTFSIALGLAVDDTIHMLTRFDEERAAGHTRDEAIRRSARGAGRAVVVTSLMLVGGMGALLWSSFVPIRHFSTLLMVCVGACLVADLVILPALLRLAWPQNAPPTSHRPNAAEEHPKAEGAS